MKGTAEKKLVIGSFVVLATALVALLVRYALVSGATSGDARTMQVLASQKEIAAALKDPARREETVRTLREQKDVAAVDLLAALGHKNKDPAVRAAALKALGDIVDPDDTRSVQVLVLGTRDEAPDVRMAALQSLERVATEWAYETVAAALTDTDLAVRRTAAEVLSLGKQSSAAVEKLVAAFPEEEDSEVRRLMAVALGRMPDREARLALLSALDRDEEREPSVRVAAVESLGAWQDVAGAQGLAVGLCDDDAAVRGRAGELLADLDRSTVTNLAAALRLKPLPSVLSSRPEGSVALGRMLDLCAKIDDPAVADALVPILDIAVGPDDQPLHPTILDRAVKQLRHLGRPAVPVLAGAVLQPCIRLPMKAAGAEALAGLGRAGLASIRAYVESRPLLPTSREAGLWLRTVEGIGGPGVSEAVTAIRARDPSEYFKKYVSALPPLDTTRCPAPQQLELTLILHRGIYGGNPPSAYARRQANLPFVKMSPAEKETPRNVKYVPKWRANLMLDLVKRSNGWDRVNGHSGAFFNSATFGRVEHLEMSPTGLTGKLRVMVKNDPWLVGGYGEYDVELKRRKDGSYRGAYRGTHRNVPIKGVATCTRKPKRRRLRAGFRPLEPGEHPRLLFRRDWLPRLRARLNTPLGQEVFEQLATAKYYVRHASTSYAHVARGILYQITGDARYALEAIPMVESEMELRDFGFRGLGGIWATRFANIAYAYDLCYDAWPGGFRNKVRQYLVNAGEAVATNMGKFSSSANTHPSCNYFNSIVAGGSVMPLALWLDPGQAPAAPGGMRVVVPAPMAKEPAGDAPRLVVSRTGREGRWLWTGPIHLPVPLSELIEKMSAAASDATVAGSGIAVGKQRFSLGSPAPGVPQTADGVFPWPSIEWPEDGSGGAGVSMGLCTVLQAASEGYYRVRLPPQGQSVCRIGGEQVLNGDYVRLERASYPLYLAFWGDRETAVPAGVLVRFATDYRAEIDVLTAEAAEKAKGARLLHELDMAEHRATGMSGAEVDIYRTSLQNMYRNHRLMLGDGGFQTEGEVYNHGAITPLRYAHVCWNVFGQTLTPHPDITHLLPRNLATGVLHERKGRLPRAFAQSYNGANVPPHPSRINFIAAGFAFTPSQYQPNILWFWNRLTGVDEEDPETLRSLVRGKGLGVAIWTLLNYPLDPVTGKPSMKAVHPEDSFPKTWQATGKGLYMFRNAYSNQQDVVLQVYANEEIGKAHGQPDAGGIRLHGLGYNWTADSPSKHTPYRWLQCVPILPYDDTIGISLRREYGTSGRVTSWDAEPNGSGHVSIDLDMVYRKERRGHDHVCIWPPDPIPPGKITGQRAVAVDYSGACGAPALIVIVDEIRGGRERKWLWHLPEGRQRAGDLQVNTDADRFTIRQGDASLQAVFVGPKPTQIEAPGSFEGPALLARLSGKKQTRRGVAPERFKAGIVATGAAGKSFFVIMTLQKGTAPEVRQISGTGLDTVVLVGEQGVRFDGDRVVIGKQTNDKEGQR